MTWPKRQNKKSSNVSKDLPENLVFQIDHLREKILTYVIRADALRFPQTKSCRLVSKSWLHSISQCFLRLKKPLFIISMGNKDDAKNEKSDLRKFLRCFNDNPELNLGIAPTTISVNDSFLTEENRLHFIELLALCGNSVIHMQINVIENNACSMAFFFPSLSFKIMDSLFLLLNMTSTNAEVMHLVQSILNGCQNLKAFHCVNVGFPSEVPPGYWMAENKFLMVLPATIEKVNLILPISPFKFLCKNELPKLTELSLNIDPKILTNVNLTKILNKFRNSLVDLSLHAEKSEDHVTPYHIQMPFINYLTSLDVNCFSNLRFDTMGVRLDQKLPKLYTLRLTKANPVFLQHCFKNGRFDAVKVLCVSHENEYLTDFNEEILRLIKSSNPSVESLEVTFSVENMTGLKWIFRNMNFLRVLRIHLVKSDLFVNADVLDSVFVGIPVQFATGLRLNPTFWQQLELKESEEFPSIRQMTALEELKLDGNFGNETVYTAPIFISDAVFRLALLNMPKLKKLIISGNFEVSREMKQLWISKGREIDRWC